MSFCKDTIVIIVNLAKTSVKANPKGQGASPNAHIPSRKALPFFESSSYYNRGSMAVEAALAVPLFLFFIINLLSLILMYEKYSVNLANLHQEAKIESTLGGLAASTGDDIVSLTIPQVISPYFSEIGFTRSAAKVTAKCRKWTGYKRDSISSYEKDDEYVYMTENGAVFHRSRECKHLKISIQIIDPSSIGTMRNECGEIYRRCEKCGYGSTTGLYFITKQGNRYHNSIDCSGLKRNIKTVKLSDIPGVPGCGACS